MLTNEQKFMIIYRKTPYMQKHGCKSICPFCLKNYNKSFLHHLELDHKNLYNDACDVVNLYNSRKNSETIECPICGVFLKDLGKHLCQKHDIHDKEEFKILYPEFPLKSIKTTPYKEKVCEYCGKICKNESGYSAHLKNAHNIKRNICNESKGEYSCLICGRKTNQIKQHVVQSHNIDWEFYCNNYGWSIDKTVYISKEHREKLSKNKKIFYKSERGLELRKDQSIKWSKNNPSNSEKFKLKLSNLRSKDIIDDSSKLIHSYGLKVKCPIIGLSKHTRSFEEYKVAYLLYKNNIKFEYEPQYVLVNLNNIKYCIPDFKINNEYFEIKTDKKHNFNEEKYETIRNYFKSIGINYYIFTCDELCKKLNIDTSYIDNIYLDTKNYLDTNNAHIYVTLYNNKESRILRKIDDNYENNENIFIYRIERK